jgi:hypothetical protein
MVETAFELLQHRVEEAFGNDSRSVEELEALLWFGSFLWSDLERVNIVLRGVSFKCSTSGTLMTVRVTRSGEHDVCFVSAINPEDCLRIFRRMWLAEAVFWSHDKFG